MRRSRSGKSFEAVFDEGVCAACPLQARCPAKPRKRQAVRVLRFTWQDLRRAERRRQAWAQRETGRNLRAAVKATHGEKPQASLRGLEGAGARALPGGVYGAWSVAVVVNIRRLHRAIQAGYGPKEAPPG